MLQIWSSLLSCPEKVGYRFCNSLLCSSKNFGNFQFMYCSGITEVVRFPGKTCLPPKLCLKYRSNFKIAFCHVFNSKRGEREIAKFLFVPRPPEGFETQHAGRLAFEVCKQTLLTSHPLGNGLLPANGACFQDRHSLKLNCNYVHYLNLIKTYLKSRLSGSKNQLSSCAWRGFSCGKPELRRECLTFDSSIL